MQARIGIVVAALFLLFGLAFGFVVMQEMSASEVGLTLLLGGFLLIWVVVCAAMIAFYLRMLSRARSPGGNSLVDIQIEGQRESSVDLREGSFAERIRQLEGLKQDGLITDEEYQSKRSQILEEKW
jgi:hypothetical protein